MRTAAAEWPRWTLGCDTGLRAFPRSTGRLAEEWTRRSAASRGPFGTVAQMQPRQAFFRKYVPRRSKSGGLVECADMKMHFRRGFAFARQGGPAPRAEPAQPAGRRIELRYLPFGYRVSVTAECHEYRDRRTAMLATALAMTPCHSYRVSRGDKLHRAAQAPALELFGHVVTLPCALCSTLDPFRHRGLLARPTDAGGPVATRPRPPRPQPPASSLPEPVQSRSSAAAMPPGGFAGER